MSKPSQAYCLSACLPVCLSAGPIPKDGRNLTVRQPLLASPKDRPALRTLNNMLTRINSLSAS